MKRFFLQFLLLCKRQGKQTGFLLLCLALPIFCLLIRNLERHSDSSLCIGLFADTQDDLLSSCFSELTSSDGSLRFLLYDQEESMKQDVASGTLDCAYTFPPSLRTLLLEQNYKKCITCYTSSSTILDDLSQEIVFAALFRHFGKDIVLHYTNQTDFFPTPQKSRALRKISSLYSTYLEGEEVFSLQYQYLNQSASEESPDAVVMPVRGLIAVLLFISGLSGGVSFLKDQEQKLRVSAICSIIVPLLFMSCSAFLTLCLTKEAGNLLSELCLLFCYLVSIVIFVRLLVNITKKPAWLCASIPVFTLGSLLFCPIFVNLGAISPFFHVMEKLFLPYYYLLLS